jgi:hypothetical protein
MVVEVAQAYTQLSAMEEPQAPEPPREDFQPAHAGNGVAREPEMAEAAAEMDAVAAGMARAAAYPEEQEGSAEEEEEQEAESAPKSSLAQRFVARREARRARKGEGVSLSDRLRGLVADRS